MSTLLIKINEIYDTKKKIFVRKKTQFLIGIHWENVSSQRWIKVGIYEHKVSVDIWAVTIYNVIILANQWSPLAKM